MMWPVPDLPLNRTSDAFLPHIVAFIFGQVVFFQFFSTIFQPPKVSSQVVLQETVASRVLGRPSPAGAWGAWKARSLHLSQLQRVIGNNSLLDVELTVRGGQ